MYYQLTDSIIFWQRIFPSANMTLILGEKPILIDTGFGSDFPETCQLLDSVGVPPKTSTWSSIRIITAIMSAVTTNCKQSMASRLRPIILRQI